MNIKIRNLLLIWGAAFFLLFSAFEGFAAQTKHRPTKHPRKKHRSYGAPEKHPRPLHPKKKYMISPPAVRPKAPGSSHVWVPRYRHPSGVYVGGYWRHRQEPVLSGLRATGMREAHGYSVTGTVKGETWICLGSRILG